MELHLFDTHNIRSDYIIEAAIKDGKRLGAKLDKNSIQKLDLEYSRYLDKEKEKTPPSSIHSITYEAVGGCQEGITQHTKNSFAFMPIISVDEFFKDDYNNSALPSHSLEQSPVASIIGMKCAGRFGTMYYCEICHPEFANDSTVSNINMSSIEHHIKYRDPDKHKAEVLMRLKHSQVHIGEETPDMKEGSRFPRSKTREKEGE